MSLFLLPVHENTSHTTTATYHHRLGGYDRIPFSNPQPEVQDPFDTSRVYNNLQFEQQRYYSDVTSSVSQYHKDPSPCNIPQQNYNISNASSNSFSSSFSASSFDNLSTSEPPGKTPCSFNGFSTSCSYSSNLSPFNHTFSSNFRLDDANRSMSPSQVPSNTPYIPQDIPPPSQVIHTKLDPSFISELERTLDKSGGATSTGVIPALTLKQSSSVVPTIKPPPQSLRVKRGDALGNAKIVDQWTSKDVNLGNSHMRAGRCQSVILSAITNDQSARMSSKLAALNLNSNSLALTKTDKKFDNLPCDSPRRDNPCDIR